MEVQVLFPAQTARRVPQLRDGAIHGGFRPRRISLGLTIPPSPFRSKPRADEGGFPAPNIRQIGYNSRWTLKRKDHHEIFINV